MLGDRSRVGPYCVIADSTLGAGRDDADHLALDRALRRADFADLVADLGETLYRALDHQELPLTEVVGLHDRAAADSLFPTTLFTVVTTPPPTFALADATAVVSTPTRPGLARNELYVVLVPSATGIHVVMEYSTDLFDSATVVSMGATFSRTLASLVEDPRLR